MARLKPGPYPGNWDTDVKKNFSAELRRTDLMFASLLKKQPRSTSRSYVGAVLSFPIADGAAYYVVVQDHPLTVQHLLIDDGWRANRCTIAGIDRAEVRDQLRWQRT